MVSYEDSIEIEVTEIVKKVREGYKMTKLGDIPEDWEVNKLKEVLITIGGYALKSSKFEPNKINKSYQVIRMGNVQMGCLDLKRNQVFIKSEQLEDKEKEYILNIGDVLISLTGTINKRDYGNIAWVNKNDSFILNQRVACVRPQDREIVNRFYYYLFQTEMFRNQFFVCGMGGTGNQANVSINDFKDIFVLKPKNIEQQKISLILSTVDEKLENTDNLIEKTKKLKKGLMQRLLKKGIGHDRFKDTEIGRIPEEWEVRKIRDVADIISGGTPNTKQSEYWDNGNILWATPTDITSSGKYISKTANCITQIGLKNSSANLLPVGTILMTSRATIGERCINKIPMCTNQGFKSFICKDGLYNEFMFYLVELIKKDLIALSAGSTFLETSKSTVENYKIVVPPIEEQNQIATILSSIDEKIEKYQSKKEKLQELKKGLMQKLLTGKIRVQ